MSTEGWRRGPVAITGANGQVGTALQKRLKQTRNEVRPLDRGNELRSAVSDAEVVVHLAGGLVVHGADTYQSANLDTVLSTLDAIVGSSVRRLVFLSFITADPRSANEYLRAKGEAETLVSSCGVPAVIFRCDHIYGPPGDPGPTASAFLSKGGKRVRILGKGTQRLSPVFKHDVVEAIVHGSLDPSTPTGTFELAGPRTVTADEFAQQLNLGTVRLHHTGPWLSRGLAHVVPALTPTLVDVMLRDAVATDDPQVAARAFGVTLRSVEDLWRRPEVGGGGRESNPPGSLRPHVGVEDRGAHQEP